MKELTLHTPFAITSAETDMYMRLRAGSLLNFLIQSAIQSADNMGFGFKNLKQQHLYWVLSRLTVEIYHPLSWYQTVKVETWPKDVDGLLYLRDFIVYNADGAVAAKAVSGWMAIDLAQKRPRLVDEASAEAFVRLREKHALTEKPEKLLEIQADETFQVTAGYFDIDLNKHVTSTRYVDWMMDTFSPEFHKIHYPKRLSINFMKETMPGDVLSISREQINKHTFGFQGVNTVSQKVVFRGKIEF